MSTAKNLVSHFDFGALEVALDQIAIIGKTDLQGRIVFANDLFESISGFSKSELIGSDHRIVNSGYHSKDFFKSMWKTISSGQIWKGEIKNKKKNGEYYWVDTIIFPIHEESGAISGYYSIRRDITKEKEHRLQLERDLNEKLILSKLLEVSILEHSFDQRLKRLFEIIVELPWLPVKTEGGLFLYENGVLSLKYQSNLHPEIQRLCSKVKLGQCLCGRAAQLKKVIHASCIDERHEITFEGISPHGHYNFPLLAGDELFGVIVLYLDHGHQKSEREIQLLNVVSKISGVLVKSWRLENQIETNKVKSMVETKFSALGQLAGGVAHELKNPLAILLGRTELLAEEAISTKNTQMVEDIRVIQKTCYRMSNIIDGIMHISSTNLSPKKDMTLLNNIVAETMPIFKETFSRSNIKWSTEVSKSLPPINVNPIEISRVLIYLINNALDAIEKQQNPEISVRGFMENNQVILEVFDNGCGIPIELGDRILEPFVTTKQSLKKPGLGLSVARSLCENNNGHISYRSQPEKTLFWVSFPLQNPS